MARDRQIQRYSINCVSIKLTKEGKSLKYSRHLDCPEEVAKVLYNYFADLDRESCMVVNVDIKGTPINYNVVSIGTLNTSPIVPRELLKSAILSNAYGIIMAHNHLSAGDVVPSRDDINVTCRIRRVCDLMDIKFFDHLIIGEKPDLYYSFRQDSYILDDDETEKIYSIDVADEK